MRAAGDLLCYGSIPVTFHLYLPLLFTSIWGLVCVNLN